MSVIRVNKTKDFTVMSNHHLKNKNLSLKAKGLLSVMLSLPEEWDYSVAGLSAISLENDSAIKSALKELRLEGYLVITKKMPNDTDSGRIEYVYDVYEEPIQAREKQGIENLPVEILPIEVQQVENQPQLNTNILNTKEENTKVLNTEDKKKVSKKAMSFDEILDSVLVIKENPDLRDAFVEYIKMRKLIKYPLTDKALKLNINKAYELSRGDPILMQKLVEQSISMSYRGIFPLKDDNQRTYSKPPVQDDGLNEFGRMLIEEGYA